MATTEAEIRIAGGGRAGASQSGANRFEAIARSLPVDASAECATIHVRDVDGVRALHLVAASGFPPRDARRLALEPLSVAQARAVLLLGPDHSLGRSLGLCFVAGAWIKEKDDLLGLATIGFRTDRRPTSADLTVLVRAADRLAGPLSRSSRSHRTLTRMSSDLARNRFDDARLRPHLAEADLRPREKQVLELIADGLSTSEIADLLVLSRHTVRTHVRNALSRLGVHSRREAADVLRRERIERLL